MMAFCSDVFKTSHVLVQESRTVPIQERKECPFCQIEKPDLLTSTQHRTSSIQVRRSAHATWALIVVLVVVALVKPAVLPYSIGIVRLTQWSFFI